MAKLLVIVPFYNVEDLLKNCIESILQQSYQNVELCLVDDCSTDNSLIIADLYADLPNITILKNETNVGPYLSINKALYHFKDADWDYFHFHGADDMSDLRRFQKVIEYMESDPKMLGTKTTFVRVHYPSNEIAYENGRQHITTSEGIAFYRREVFENLGYFDNTRFSGDTEYFWRLQAFIKASQNGYFIGEHKEPLYLAYLRESKNLTVQIPIYNRGSYYQKIQTDIQNRTLTSDFFNPYL